MGAFFTNLHVASGAIDAVREVLAADSLARGLIVAGPGEEPDRTVVLVPGERWTSIYDEDGEVQDPKILDRVGKALSKAVGPAFSVLIHDSDVLRLGLYEGGKRTDQFDSDPSYFGGRGKKTNPDDHVAAWRAFARAGSDETLRKVFGREELFAEAALPVLADLLGIAPGRLGTGYNYLSQEEGLPDGAIVLAWCAKDRPNWRKPATGAPKLETQWENARRTMGMANHTLPPPPDTEVAVGGAAHISITTLNAGGGGKGLVVEVSGDDVVAWDKIQLVLGDPRESRWIEQPVVRDGDRYVARFPEAPIPVGLAGETLPTSNADAMKLMDARFATQVHANVIGKGARAGRAVFAVRITPDEGTGTGVGVAIAVRSTADRPLRAPEGVHPMLVAPLEDRSRLVALVVLRPDALSRAGEVVQAVRDRFPTTGKVSTTIFPGPPSAAGGLAAGLAALMGGSKPKLATGNAAGFLEGKRWKGLLDAISGGAALVHVTWADDPEARVSAADLFVGTGVIKLPDCVPAVALGIKDAQDATALVAAIDALGGAVIQAFVTRWGQSPGVDQTPYELACGVHGQCTLHLPWVTRWLRAIGPGWLWLGPELQAHADASALAGLGGTRTGEVLRIEVRDVPATEKALAALLPDGKDWQQGVARRYGR